MHDNSLWWKSATIYQIYPRSFYDSNHDGIGDLNGITEKLPYIASIGVDAIWISPFFKSPQKDFGYDISDYCDVDPQFGSLDDFDRLIEKAHTLGLKIIIDQVYSHTSDEHEWFKESRQDRTNPKADWYVWADPKPDGTPPNNWLSRFGGSAWKFEASRKQYYLHNFVEGQPDLNLHNPEVQEAILGVTRFWLEKGVDGFRLDALGMSFHDQKLRDNPPCPKGFGSACEAEWQSMKYTCDRPEMDAWVQKLRAQIDAYPDKTTIGELSDIDTIARYTGDQGKGLHMGYSFELLDNDCSKELLVETLEKANQDLRDGWICQALGNHDRKRIVSRWTLEGASKDQLSKLFATLLASLRGSICLYQGEELGLEEAVLNYEDLVDPFGLATWPEEQGRDGCRTPIPWDGNRPYAGFSSQKPWLPMQSFHKKSSVAEQDHNPESTLNFYRKLMIWRKEMLPFILGTLDIISTPEHVLGFVRTDEKGQKLLCLFNLSRETINYELAQDALSLVVMSGFSSTIDGPEVILPPFEAAFVSIR